MKLSQIWQIKILRKLNSKNVDKDTLFFTLTLLVGVISGLVAVLIKTSVAKISHIIGTHETVTMKSLIQGGILIFVSGYLTTRFFPGTSGSGIPQTKIALIVHHGKITFKEWFAKLNLSIISLSSGIVLGREGPTVNIASGIGSTIGSFFSMPKTKIKSLVAVGAAGGIAAAFNTPIAAVTFTLEEVVGNLNAKSLGPIVISSVVAAVTARYFEGNEPIFSVLQYKFTDPQELLYYLVVGLACALIGPLWVKTVLKLRETNRKVFKHHKLTVIMLSFFAVMAASLITPEVLGSGHHVINEALLSNLPGLKTILIILVLKFFLVSFVYSSGISGGLFMPTLLMGALIGSIVGMGANYLDPEASEIGAYALVGMGAYFAVVIRAPFTSILIIFEMTQDYKVILPLMISNITAYLISSRYMHGSIYEQISEQDGIHLPTKEDSDILENMTVEEAMVTDAKTLSASLTVREAINIVKNSEITGYPVMKNGLILGVVSTNQIGDAYAKFKGECLLSDICTKRLIHIYPDQSLMMAFHFLNKAKVSRLLVVSRINDKRLVGVITAEDIVNRFGYHIQEESKAHLLKEYIEKVEGVEASSQKDDEKTQT